MSLLLYRSTIEDRIEKLKGNYNGDTHETFLRLIFYLVTGRGYDDLEPEDMVDGHGEYQIDALHIDTSRMEDQAIVTIVQATYSDSLSSTKLIKMHAGLDYLLRQPKLTYSSLSNTSLRDKIQEFRDLRSEILPVNIKLQCYYASLGDPSKAAGEFPEQIKRLKTDYANDVGEYSFDVLGPNEIFELLNLRERRATKVDNRLRIVYDRNKASLLEHSIEGVYGVICTIETSEIARIVEQYPTVFDDNLRRFLGSSGTVNKAIRASCASETDAHLFWFLNNGITIVCDDYDINKDFDNPFIDLQNIRIVNGCQTATTLAKAQKAGQLQASTKVMLRVFKTRSAALASKLVVTTNTQNKITSRDLHAQDQIQKDIQAEFGQRFGIKYERTPNEFVGQTSHQVISNEKIGQAFIAIVKKRLGDARSRQYKIWGEHYEHIFTSSVYPETYLLVYRIAEFCVVRKRQIRSTLPDNDIRRVLAASGIYHLARITAFNWRNGDDWNDLEQVRRELQKLQDEPDLLVQYYDEALEMLADIFEADKQFKQDPSVALKSSRLEEAIERQLYSQLGVSKKRKTRRRKSTSE